MTPVDTPHSYPVTQAGGNPDVSLFFRFCGPGLAVDNVVTEPNPALGRFVVTTKAAHDVINPFTFVKMRGVRTPALWVRPPGFAQYLLVRVDTTPETPTFRYTPTVGDGTYSIFTRGIDRVDNGEDPPAIPDLTWTVGAPQNATGIDGIAEPSSRTPPVPVAQGPRACVGELTLSAEGSIRTSRRVPLKLGSSRSSIAPGRAARINVQFSRRGRRVARSTKRLRVVVQLKLDGGKSITRRLTLKR